MAIELRNTTINPFPGLFSDVEVTLETAKKLIAHLQAQMLLLYASK